MPATRLGSITETVRWLQQCDGDARLCASTTLLSGTDNQAFCYDEQNRLTWSSSASGSIQCGGTNTAGTLTAASYTQSFAYDTKGRLTTGPAGASIYADSAHEHAVTSTSNGYHAAYDAAGDMLCRASSSSTTCSGTQTGAQITYDRERRATHWQNTPSSPTSTDDLRYDGAGTRIEQRTVSGGTTATTYYLLGGQEEVQIVSGGATTLTKYYPTGSATHLPQPMKVGTTISYLATDGLDTVSEAVDGAGTVTAQQLYLPYGGSRYSSGTMPTSKGYTGQRADAATGLDYYGARYYDPLVGQFTSADDILPGIGYDPWGLSRYAYVEGNPISRNDPMGHCPWCVIGAIVGAVVGAAIAYGVQAYNNHEHGMSWQEALSPNHIDLVTVGTAALAGALIGGTMGAGATEAAAMLGAGSSVGSAVVAGGTAAVTYAAYGIEPTTVDTSETDTEYYLQRAAQIRAQGAPLDGRKMPGNGGVALNDEGSFYWEGTSGHVTPDEQPTYYDIPEHPYDGACFETRAACAYGQALENGDIQPGSPVRMYYNHRRDLPPCSGCMRTNMLLAQDNQAPVYITNGLGNVTIYPDQNFVWGGEW